MDWYTGTAVPWMIIYKYLTAEYHQPIKIKAMVHPPPKKKQK